MSEKSDKIDKNLLQEWQQKIETANQNNIFCHCQTCGEEWIDSSLDAICITCGSKKVEHIACWQFPDD